MTGEHIAVTDSNHPYLSLGTGYFLHASTHSQYQGIFARQDNTLFKYIDAFDIDHDIHTVERRPGAIQLHTDDGTITIEQSLSGVRLAATMETEMDIHVDMRYIHDYDTAGRIYNIERDDTTRITYTKYETDECTTPAYDETLRIDAANWSSTEEWMPKAYEYDERRGIKSDFWVFNAGSITIEPNRPAHIHIPLSQRHQTIPVFKEYGYEDNDELRIAAGYPWFHDAWSRDEIISLEPIIEHAPGVARDLLVSAAERDQGKQSVDGSSLASADTPGWLARRAGQLIKRSTALEDQTIISDYLERRWEDVNRHDELIANEARETWMDTDGGTDDDRRGIRIEIQAGWLEALRFLTEHADASYQETYETVKQAVQQHLVKSGVAYDGREDGVLDWRRRPNVFLAYYLHSDMLPDAVWEQTFDRVIDACWLDWGGLSSIGIEDALFCSHHTGVDNRSYHRGDSWYYVNNIAAMALHDLNPQKYLKYVEAIRRASRKDKENHGAIGACSEISSAAEQTSHGCFSQAWSDATLRELNRWLTQDRLS
jgi:hypothetical protein